jgi:glycosyltransferase involved in cell wall biosynthesis
MWVGLDGTPLIGELTGIGWYTYLLAEALARQPEVRRIDLLPITWRRALVATPPGDRVHVVRRPLPARPMWWAWRRTGMPPLEALLRPDVFHGTNFTAPPSRRTPVVVTVHDLWFRRHPDGVDSAQRVLARVLPPLLRRAAAVLTVSEHTRAELLDWLPELADRTTVVPIAPRPRYGAANVPARLPDPAAPFLLMLGTVNRRRNLPAALDALMQVRREVGPIRLVLAGRVESTVDLDGLRRTRGLEAPDVLALGYVPDGEARWLLEHAELLLSSSAHEGFGMPVVEAMAAGLPVAAVAGGAVREVAGDGAALVDSPEGLGAVATRLLVDAPARAELMRRGRERARGFSWDSTAGGTLAVYRRVLE